jgi:hypothetical protein
MKLEINLNGNLLDYVDEEEIKSDIVNEVKRQIKEQVTNLIAENKTEIQERLIHKIIKEMLNETSFNKDLKELLYTKVYNGVAERYSTENDFNLRYDLDLSNKVREAYDAKKEELDEILCSKIDDTLKDYSVDNYIISTQVANILANNEKYKDQLEELLSYRLEEIFNKF